jgi:hypothetical protein
VTEGGSFRIDLVNFCLWRSSDVGGDECLDLTKTFDVLPQVEVRDNRDFPGHDPPEFLGDLLPWLGRARTSLVASFGNGVMKDQAAVATAITSGGWNDQKDRSPSSS